MPKKRQHSLRHGPEVALEGARDPRQFHGRYRSRRGAASSDESPARRMDKRGGRINHVLQEKLGSIFKGPNRLARRGLGQLRRRPRGHYTGNPF